MAPGVLNICQKDHMPSDMNEVSVYKSKNGENLNQKMGRI